MSQVIKRFILHAKKTAFVVEHDFIMATYLADQVIGTVTCVCIAAHRQGRCSLCHLTLRVAVYEGSPGRDCKANSPQSLLTGMNQFLQNLDITFRRDPTNNRPRINKVQSPRP